MPEYLTTAEAAERLNVTPQRVRELLRSQSAPGAPQRLPGARKVGRDWIIPVEAVEAFRRQPEGRPGHFSKKR